MGYRRCFIISYKQYVGRNSLIFVFICMQYIQCVARTLSIDSFIWCWSIKLVQPRHFLLEGLYQARKVSSRVFVYAFCINKRWRIPKGQSKINVREYRRGNHEWTFQRNCQHRVHKTKKSKSETQHNMFWTSLYTNKHQQRKYDLSYQQLKVKTNRTSFHAEIVTDITTRDSKRKDT